MSKLVSIIEASKSNWSTLETNQNGYPGDAKMKIGCLQRIASATEAMSKNYVELQNQVEKYKRWYEIEEMSNKELRRKVAALKGVITRLKNKQA